MKTAEEMIKYIDEHNLGKGMTKGWRKKHFKLAAEQLRSDEEALTCFMGLHNYNSPTKHNNFYAYVITNDRFIMAQDKLIGNNLQIVSRKHLNDIHKSTGLVYGVLTFDTFKETFNVGVDKITTDNIFEKAYSILFDAPENVIEEERKKSPVEELKEYKELLDMEIITQEEFDQKKSELL